MSSQLVKSAVKSLGIFQKPSLFDKGVGALLPEEYKKFYKEWKLTEPTAVHYIPEEGKWKRDELTGEVKPVQNLAIPLIHPKEADSQIWGGEGVIQGFTKKSHLRRRVPHFWFPVLKRSVVYSEILDKYISVIITDRAISLINSNYGFDHYLLKTPACDLKSLLPLRIKRKLLQELEKGCPTYSHKPEKQKQVLGVYKKYLAAFTSEEIKWYGYSYFEACKILEKELEAQEKPVPLKNLYRAQLIEKLKAASLADQSMEQLGESEMSSSWLQKINPFGKKRET